MEEIKRMTWRPGKMKASEQAWHGSEQAFDRDSGGDVLLSLDPDGPPSRPNVRELTILGTRRGGDNQTESTVTEYSPH